MVNGRDMYIGMVRQAGFKVYIIKGTYVKCMPYIIKRRITIIGENRNLCVRDQTKSDLVISIALPWLCLLRAVQKQTNRR